ncbi:hypothetical protein [Verrucosispora sioxanthis]|uniref:hypothetical protein n=1 Tax=Verrucosispora sioxanthis TaxID=2499994 RepID=UPI001C10ED30|nr:hypothetical protein [Verrucosispora sioxanthis]
MATTASACPRRPVYPAGPGQRRLGLRSGQQVLALPPPPLHQKRRGHPERRQGQARRAEDGQRPLGDQVAGDVAEDRTDPGTDHPTGGQQHAEQA